MGKGQYVVYERVSRDEERMFLEIAKEVVDELGEPKNWKSKRDLKKHAGGRPAACSFRQMLLILLLMVYHRKEYREMEAHLKSNPSLLEDLGLKRAPGKSSIHRAARRIGIATLVKMNDAIIARFKKIEEEPMVHHQNPFGAVQEERLSQAPHSFRMQEQGEADLLLDSHISIEA